jgi:hypothetical protein
MSIFISGLSVSVVYLLFRFIEMRFILKENKPLKLLFRDTLIVYLSVVIGNVVLTQIIPDNLQESVPKVFTNQPDF